MSIEQNDPTASGFLPPKGATRLSGNETEMLCLKAARGAGMPWGLAEEAGFAARWLQARGIDGPGALLGHLDWLAGRDASDLSPRSTSDLTPRCDGPLCPIATGATLSDVRQVPDGPLGPVISPILLLPFLHSLARATGLSVRAVWQGGTVNIRPMGAISGDVADLIATERANFELSLSDTGPDPATTADARPTADCLARLNDYAMNITVPATQSSRVDAGAGTSDND